MVGVRNSKLVCSVILVVAIGCASHHRTKPESTTTPEDGAGVVDEQTEETIPETSIPEESVSSEEGTEEEESQSVSVTEVPNPASTPPREEPPKYNDEDLKLAKGIFRLNRKRHRGIWWECGERHETKQEVKDAALERAKAINEAHRNTIYKLRSGKEVRVPIREAVGIMISESKFDRCAIGPHPRRFAYERKILKRPPNHISHTLEEIKKVVEHPLFRGKKADIGVGQIVKRLGRGHMEWEEVSDFLTVVPGVQKVFDEMAHRGSFYNTRHPSLYWPGNPKHEWYKNRVLRRSAIVFQPIPRKK